MLKTSFAAAALLLSSHVAQAQNFPNGVVSIVVPADPGGATSVAAHLLAERLTKAWGSPVIVVNRPGANGGVGASQVARAKPDGQTLLLSAEATFVINPYIYKKLQYDGEKDFQPVSGVVSSAQGIVINPQVPARNLSELMKLASSKPGEIRYGTPGAGSTGHLNAESLAKMAGVKLAGVHYKGASQARSDVMGGHIDMMVVSLGQVDAGVKAGKMTLLAVGAKQRVRQMPNVPTVIESGIDGYEANTWFGLFAPSGTPVAIVEKINGAVQEILRSPEVRADYLDANFMEPMLGDSREFEKFVHQERVKWKKVISDAKVTLD